MRLRTRRVRVWNASYLVYRYLWPNLLDVVAAAKSSLPAARRNVLDIGCGNKPYADLFADCSYIGLNNTATDADPDIVADALRLPIATGSIDLVFCTQVLEHVRDPAALVAECYRVLGPGGCLVLSAPFYWPLHEEPHDYFRFTRYGLEHLLRGAGLSQLDIRPDGGDQARLFLSITHALPRWLELPLRIPLNLAGSFLDRAFHTTVLPANYTVLARKA